jgi:hypothetical protein
MFSCNLFHASHTHIVKICIWLIRAKGCVIVHLLLALSHTGTVNLKLKSHHISGVIDTNETDFRDFRSDYLGEYEAICDTVLARESGP